MPDYVLDVVRSMDGVNDVVPLFVGGALVKLASGELHDRAFGADLVNRHGADHHRASETNSMRILSRSVPVGRSITESAPKRTEV